MLPSCFVKLADFFQREGYELYLVGGSVRDLYFNPLSDELLQNSDLDMNTDAHPDDVIRIVEGLGAECSLEGKGYGSVAFRLDGYHCEVTTMRIESCYVDGRHPNELTYTTELDDDLMRRDFTINAMALHADGTLHDPYGGLDDMKVGVIRTVGDANICLSEDRLRILRAFRFSASLTMKLDVEIENAILTMTAGACQSDIFEGVSIDRIRSEMEKMLSSDGGMSGLQALLRTGVIHPVPNSKFKDEGKDFIASLLLDDKIAPYVWRFLKKSHRLLIGWMILGSLIGPWDYRIGLQAQGNATKSAGNGFGDAMRHSILTFRLQQSMESKVERLQKATEEVSASSISEIVGVLSDELRRGNPREVMTIIVRNLISDWWDTEMESWFQALSHLRRGEAALFMDWMILRISCMLSVTSRDFGRIELENNDSSAALIIVNEIVDFITDWFERTPVHLSEINLNHETLDAVDQKDIGTLKRALMKEIWQSGGGKSNKRNV